MTHGKPDFLWSTHYNTHRCMARATRPSYTPRASVASAAALGRSNARVSPPQPTGATVDGSRLDGYLQALYAQAAQPLQLEASTRDCQAAPPLPRIYDGGAHRLVASSEQSSNDYLQGAVSLQEAKNPGRLRFEELYSQLAGWRTVHLACHVPRNCFDAPPLLGAWVRHMRRLHKAGNLPQWQVDRLNLLGFEWRLDDASAKWINMYHQARRFRAVHGHMDVATAQLADTQDGGRFGDLARWLDQQAEALAAGKFTEQQVGMLRLLGVSLVVPRTTVEHQIELQGLNAHERKQLNRKVKLATTIT